jgi:hypothetical protein
MGDYPDSAARKCIESVKELIAQLLRNLIVRNIGTVVANTKNCHLRRSL